MGVLLPWQLFAPSEGAQAYKFLSWKKKKKETSPEWPKESERLEYLLHREGDRITWLMLTCINNSGDLLEAQASCEKWYECVCVEGRAGCREMEF